MKAKDQRDNDRKFFLEIWSRIAKLKLEDLVRKNLGEINFEPGEELFQQMISFSSKAINYDWKLTPLSSLLDQPVAPNQQSLRNELTELTQSIDQIIGFSIRTSGTNPETRRNQFLDRLESSWMKCSAVLMPLLNYLISMDTTMLSKSEELIRQRLIELDAAKSKIENDQKVVGLVLQSVQSAARETGVSQEAIHFDRLAKTYLKASIAWIIGAIAFGWLTYDYATTHLPQIVASDFPTFLRMMFPRLVIISLFLTGLFFCLKNFSAVTHNQIVNRHRQTALSTFQTFINGTSDHQTKNAVLLQATRAIFLPQASGYLKGEAENPQVSQITEVVRGVTEQSKSE
jgi:hypothetical protein